MAKPDVGPTVHCFPFATADYDRKKREELKDKSRVSVEARQSKGAFLIGKLQFLPIDYTVLAIRFQFNTLATLVEHLRRKRKGE